MVPNSPTLLSIEGSMHTGSVCFLLLLCLFGPLRNCGAVFGTVFGIDLKIVDNFWTPLIIIGNPRNTQKYDELIDNAIISPVKS